MRKALLGCVVALVLAGVRLMALARVQMGSAFAVATSANTMTDAIRAYRAIRGGAASRLSGPLPGARPHSVRERPTGGARLSGTRGLPVAFLIHILALTAQCT